MKPARIRQMRSNLGTMNLMMLATLEALYLHRKTTVAAEKLGIAQPSVSWYLKQLREMTGDDLFIRSSKGLEPTDFCTDYYRDAKSILDSYEALSVRRNAPFDPATTAAQFAVAIPYFKARMLLEGLSVGLMKKYPLVQADLLYLQEADALFHLESGQLDTYIGIVSEKLPKNFAMEKILATEFVVLCSDKSPFYKTGKITRKAFLDTPHIKLAAGFAPSPIDVIFKKHGLLQTKLVTVPDIGSEIIMLRETAHLLIVDRLDAEIFMHGNNFRILKTEFAIPQMPLYAVWHLRKKNHSAHAWLRRYVKEHCDAYNKGKKLDLSRFTA